jgi:hypothetical protein
MPAAPSARLSLLLAGLAAACGEAAPPTPSLSVDAALVQAGDAVTVTWQAPEAATVELTDTEGRALLLGGAKQGSLQVAILRSTTLRLVARGDAADAEASVRVEARPRLVADLQANLHRAGETDFTLRWDSLGAAAWDLQVGELQEATFAGGPRGAYAGVARGQGAVPVRLRAAAEALEATWTGTVAVYPGEVEPNDALAEAGPAGAGVVGRFDPEGRDLFLVEVPEGGHVQARLQDPTGGCAARGDLRLLSEDGAVWAYAEGGASCAALGPEAAPGDRDLPAGRYPVEVTGPAEADYLLLVAVSAPVCGDGVVSTRAGEHCEPSRSPEVCRADCTVDAVAEVEPNGSPRSAQAVPLGRWVVGRVDTPRGPGPGLLRGGAGRAGAPPGDPDRPGAHRVRVRPGRRDPAAERRHHPCSAPPATRRG